MKDRYRLIRRGLRGRAFYCVDTRTGKRNSLGTADASAARQIVFARNQAERQPMLNLQLARAYLLGSDSTMNRRTWRDALESLILSKQGANQQRWRSVLKDRALASLLPLVVVQTDAEAILKALRGGTVSTNVFLRRLHNFCVDMNWLPWPLVPKRQWPTVRYRSKRAITHDEHRAIVAREGNDERRAFYELAWHLGASQTDLALLEADNIDWPNRIISYTRKKSGEQAAVRFDEPVAAVLRSLPARGPLFPYLRGVRAADRATEFKQRCRGLRISGVTLHSYRYAWAERAKSAGYPERFAQQALGHNSKAVHRAYARHAHVIIPSLGEYEKQAEAQRVIPFPAAVVPGGSVTPLPATSEVPGVALHQGPA